MESLELYCPDCERMTTFSLDNDDDENEEDPSYRCANCELSAPLSELEGRD